MSKPNSHRAILAAKVIVCLDEVWFRCASCDSLNLNGQDTTDSLLVECPDCGQRQLMADFETCDCECCQHPNLQRRLFDAVGVLQRLVLGQAA